MLRADPALELQRQKKKEEELRKLAFLEITYSLLPKSPATAQQRQKLAFALFLKHRDGIKDKDGFVFLAEDERLKADYFLAEALLFTSAVPPAMFFLTFLARFTSSRLAVVRGFRLHPLPFLAPITPTGAVFNALQLSYFVEFAFCFSILMEKSLRPQTNKDEWWFQRIEGHRFTQALLDREFLGIFTNTVIWGLVNGICYFDSGITPAAKALWNLSGFFADIIHDWGFARWELLEYKKLQEAIENGSFDPQNFNLKDTAFQSNLTNKIKVIQFKEMRLTIAAVLIFVGMVFVFAPVLMPALVSFFHLHPLVVSALMKITPEIASTLRSIGANVVIFGGVCIAGLGGRLFFIDLTWEKLRNYTLDIRGYLSRWYNNEEAVKKSQWNFVLNALVPMGSIGGLVFLALFCPPSAAIIAGCTIMAGWFAFMKISCLPSVLQPSHSQTLPIEINFPIFDTEGKLKIDELLMKSQDDRDAFLKLVEQRAGVKRSHAISVIHQLSKEKEKRPSASTALMTEIFNLQKLPAKPSLKAVKSPSERKEEIQPRPAPLKVSSSSGWMSLFFLKWCWSDSATYYKSQLTVRG